MPACQAPPVPDGRSAACRRDTVLGVTLGLDVLMLTIDANLRVVRDREGAGYAMLAADLIELTVARRVGVDGGWVGWLRVLDARPTGDTLLDASLRSLVAAGKKLTPTDWIYEQPGRGAVNEGLAV